MYDCDCESCKSQPQQAIFLANGKGFKSLLNAVEKAYKKLHANGSYKPEDLTTVKEYKSLIDATAAVFNPAIESNVIPPAMATSLKEDVFLFSGLKTHAQLYEASRQLLTEQGTIKPFYQFSKDVEGISKSYNQTYLEAEYQFAVTSAQMAGKWADIQSGDVLQYRTAKDERVRESHRALDEITLPENDSFWLSYYPPNGWRCRCNALQVRSGKYPLSNSGEAIAKGEAATTQEGKDGKNKLEIFRFNPGKQKVVFPPNHPYNKVAGAAKVKEIMNSPKVNLADLIKGELPTNNEIKNIFGAYAEAFPEDFRNGLKEIKFQKSTSYMMQHSMGYKPSTMEWSGGSMITFSTHTFSSIGFNPAEELRNALGAIKKGTALTFKQEYAMESLWHEILHAKTKTSPAKLSTVAIKSMETINEFVARHTYNEFIERLGGTASHQQDILEKGYGYSGWITDFRKRLADNNISEKEALDYFEPHLMKNYSTLTGKILEFFKR